MFLGLDLGLVVTLGSLLSIIVGLLSKICGLLVSVNRKENEVLKRFSDIDAKIKELNIEIASHNRWLAFANKITQSRLDDLEGFMAKKNGFHARKYPDIFPEKMNES